MHFVVWIVLILLILALMYGVLLVVRRYRGRDAKVRSFRDAVRTVETATCTGRNRYDLPWVLMLSEVGAASDGLLRGARLSPIGDAQPYGHWWYATNGAVLAAPTTAFAASTSERTLWNHWRGLLYQLWFHRPGRPLDALLWAIPVGLLDSSRRAELDEIALRTKQRFAEIQLTLGMCLPVYVVVTNSENLPGFSELTDRLPERDKQAMLGWSSTFSPSAFFNERWIDLAVEQIQASLRVTVTELGLSVSEPSVAEALFLLPERVMAMSDGLHALLEPVFRVGALREPFLLRGVYFVGVDGAERGASVSDNPFQMAPQASEISEPAVFASRFFEQRVFGERGLGRPAAGMLAARTRTHNGFLACGCVVAFLWLLAMGMAYLSSRSDADTMAPAMAKIADTQEELAQEKRRHRQLGTVSDSDDWFRHSTAELVANMGKVSRWKLSSVFLPTSFLGDPSVDEHTKQALTAAYREVILGALELGLRQRAKKTTDLRATQWVGGDTSSERRAPEERPQFTALKELVVEAEQYNRFVRFYNNELLRKGGGTLKESDELMRYLFGYGVPDSFFASHSMFENIVVDASGGAARRIDTADYEKDFQRAFTDLAGSWLDSLYTNNELTKSAGAVSEHLSVLNEEAVPDVARLQSLAQQIDQLQSLIEHATLSWMTLSSGDATPVLKDLLLNAAAAPLIGESSASEVRERDMQARDRFRDKMLHGLRGLPAILVESPGKGVELNPELSGLGAALHTLLAEPFLEGERGAMAKLPVAEALSVEGVDAAVKSYQSYKKYRDEKLATAPLKFRSALEHLASRFTVHSMLTHLNGGGTTGAWTKAMPDFSLFEKRADALSEAFNDLNRIDLALQSVTLANQRALSALRSLGEQLDALEAYAPKGHDFGWWLGDAAPVLQAYDATNVQDLQDYLSAELGDIQELAHAAEVPLSWLKKQPIPWLLPERYEINRWQGVVTELEKYKAKNPVNAINHLEKLITVQLPPVDGGNCGVRLKEAGNGSGDSYFDERARDLLKQLKSRCDSVQFQQGRLAYQRLHDFFRDNLAGKFPFSNGGQALPAEPAYVARLLDMIKTDLPIARSGLAGRTDLPVRAGEFMEQLAVAQKLFSPLFEQGDGFAHGGLDLILELRANRPHERGGNQIIEWRLIVGDEERKFPAQSAVPLRWSIGQPVSLHLRWAKDSALTPLVDPGQQELEVQGKDAIWRYDGPWALFRLLRLHSVPDHGSVNTTPNTLMSFSVPIQSSQGTEPPAEVYARIGANDSKSKQRVHVAKLPDIAPSLGYSTAELGAASSNGEGPFLSEP